MSGDRLTLMEAAERLGVSRRRAEAMVQSGQLPAERVGWQWSVPVASLRLVDHNMWREAGRPLAQRSAWKSIFGGFPDSSLRSASALDRKRRQLRARARHLDVFVHPSTLSQLVDDERIVRGGRHAAQEIGVPVDSADVFGGYLRQTDLKDVLTTYAAREVLEGANVYLHVVDDDAWPFVPGQRYVDGWVAWLDLADRQDRAADLLLDRLIGGRFLA